MCLECEPENDHGCCRVFGSVMQHLSSKRHVTVPKLRARKVAHHLYTVWKRDDTGTARCVEACCGLNAKSEYTALYVLIDYDEVELNRIYALEDNRPPRPAAPSEE
jgi:hypothetical protein